MYACNGILFNHESPRRGETFVTRKITRAATRIAMGLQDTLVVGNLDAQRDWGFAGDYVSAMWKMLQTDHGDDYVVATGIARSVRMLCECAFSHVGLDYQHYVKENATSARPPETNQLVGSPEKLVQKLGWKPSTSFQQLIGTMVDADTQELTCEHAS